MMNKQMDGCVERWMDGLKDGWRGERWMSGLKGGLMG